MKFLKPILKVLGSIVILLGLIVGGAVGYVWYTGQNGIENASVTAVTAEPRKSSVITPSKPTPDSAVSASVQIITSPVMPGSNASITIKTLPTAQCTIVVEYNKVASRDSGLAPKTADDFGIVSWAWTVEPNVPYGTWPAKVTCAYNKRSAVVIGDLVVANKVD